MIAPFFRRPVPEIALFFFDHPHGDCLETSIPHPCSCRPDPRHGRTGPRTGTRARHPFRPSQQRRPPGELRRQALRGEWRKDEGAGIPGLAVRQRDAAAIRAAGRRAADVRSRHDLAGRHRQEFGLIDFPFAVANFAQADALLDGPLGQTLLSKLPEKGLVALGYWDLGFRNVTNSKRPIAKPEDLEGLKIRVIPNPVFLETFKAFKANPVPMPFAELYGALEAKAVDGQENPFW